MRWPQIVHSSPILIRAERPIATNIPIIRNPDGEPPEALTTMEQKADYMHRVVSAFDFGMAPTTATLRLFRGWQDVFDAYSLPASPGYHAIRAFFGWPAVPAAPFAKEPDYLEQDAREGRTDGCEHLV